MASARYAAGMLDVTESLTSAQGGLRTRPHAPTIPSMKSPMPIRICAAVCGTWAAACALALLSSVPTAAQQPGMPGEDQQVVLVTGSTSGLGREVALRMGRRGAHVIVHGRNEARGLAVVREIEATPGSARFIPADFASFDEVRRLARTILADYDRLDVLVNNAGFGSAPDERLVSDDGHEFRFQVNYLAPFLLTHMLLPLLEESAPARIVNVSSLAQSPIDWDDVMITRDFSGRRAYAQSKLAQVAFTFDLHERLQGTGVMVNALHPATYMPTGMVRRLGVEPRATIDEGADAVMHLIVSDEIEGGQFFNQMEPSRAHEQAYDPESRQRLRELSRRLTGIGSAG